MECNAGTHAKLLHGTRGMQAPGRSVAAGAVGRLCLIRRKIRGSAREYGTLGELRLQSERDANTQK
jgi:hypothetical protein